MLDILFSLPVLSCLLVTGSAAFGVSVVTRFVPDKTKLDQSLTRAEKALEKLRKEITGNQATMKQSQAEVEILNPSMSAWMTTTSNSRRCTSNWSAKTSPMVNGNRTMTREKTPSVVENASNSDPLPPCGTLTVLSVNHILNGFIVRFAQRLSPLSN